MYLAIIKFLHLRDNLTNIALYSLIICIFSSIFIIKHILPKSLSSYLVLINLNTHTPTLSVGQLNSTIFSSSSVIFLVSRCTST
ncbi:uncharacterized protein P174DRAFT_493935 [Aspergillus novofumigatus IBT 16806]|uniref:Uncharacterized protein n=1 Tax=Aspergillus novofumigatus (strain IBT 16806) TaxID=1392255 RepID=A0A2I1BYZ1_ASPN1|nr:uncharacterized protein P174DRAFT_493935 [Aspergillus novofumigatus IBT 16806]PKX90593.1 hypothetical protein P174DRAFT_493935 [Aspergillus novofumigatus IBT 16806]